MDKSRDLVKIGIWGGIVVFVLWAGSGIVIHNLAEPNDHGVLGDMFGAINALFSGWAFLGVIIAIILQYQELKAQREEIHQTRLAHEESAKALTSQLDTSRFHSRMESLNLLIQGQQRLLSRLDDARTVGEKERRRVAEQKLSLYEDQLSKLIELEAARLGSQDE
jgi:hypothetical protein